MLSRHQFLSPDLKPVYPSHQYTRGLASNPSSLLTRYSSAKLFERCPTTTPDLQLKKRIDSYTYSSGEQIGSGFTSKVYKARRDGCTQVFAIKVVDLKKYSTSNREMLENQVEILKTLDHPNVIKCVDVFFTVNNCYIITEYCEGGDLLSVIKRNGKGKPLQEAVYTAVVREVMEGFRYLVDKGIVHRDIKPANIFFKDNKCKIADFGFAKRISRLKPKESYNVGTPLYMPPEALLSNRYSFQSDIFSIGVMIFQMVFGASPWQSRSQKQLISKMTRLPLTFPTKTTTIPCSLKDLLTGCLATDISLRFTSQLLFECPYIQSLLNPTPSTSNPNPQHADDQQHTLKLTSKFIRHIRYDSKSTTVQDSSSKDDSSSTEVDKEKCQKHNDTLRKIQMDRNTNLLLVQVNLCRFMFYLAKNRLSMIRKVDKDRLNCVLYQHILKIMEKLIETNKTNSMKLPQYEAYRDSSAFHKVYNTFCDYQARYKRQYNNFRAKMPWQYIQLLDSQLNFLKDYKTKKMDREFYKLTSNFSKCKLKQLNSNLSFQLKKPCQQRQPHFSSSVESLRSLMKYINLLQMMTNNFEDYEYFMQYSSISVLTDYGKSTADEDLYLQLRDKAYLLTL